MKSAVIVIDVQQGLFDPEPFEAEKIREHHNCTLPNISRFGPKISTIPSNNINFGG